MSKIIDLNFKRTSEKKQTIGELTGQFVGVKSVGNKVGLNDLEIGKLPVVKLGEDKHSVVPCVVVFELVKFSNGKYALLMEEE